MPQAVAPLVAARRSYQHWAYTTSPASVPASLPLFTPGQETGLAVEIFVNSAWTDISPFVYYRNLVQISRGKPNEASQIQPQTCTFTVNNRDGRFSPRNPLGPYFGQIGRNTPVRVSRLQNGVRRYRFYGEVSAWPTAWDISGTDVYVDVTAAGTLRRLFQGNQPLHSTLYRALGLKLGLGTGLLPVAYWPCEDGQNSTQIASGLPGGSPMVLSGQALPTFASNTSFPSSLPLPLLSTSTWTGAVPAASTGNSHWLGILLSIPLTGAYDTAVLARLYTTGTVARLDLQYGVANGGSLQISGYDAGGSQLFASGYQSSSQFIGSGFNGLPALISMTLKPSSVVNTMNWQINFTTLLPLTPLFTGWSFPNGVLSGTVGTATGVVINPDGHINDTAVGHVLYSQNTDFVRYISGPLNAWATETPAVPFTITTVGQGAGSTTWTPGRFLRLCQEQNVQAAVILASGVNAGDPTTMGYQLNNTFTDLIQEPATSIGGLLFESRDQNAIVLRERGTLYNQAAALTLDYAQNSLSAPPIPVDDDAYTRNDVTVTRIGGASAVQALTAGALSTSAPPAGVGDYATNYTLSLGSDTLVPDATGWRLHMGTVDEPRYPQISINLRHSTFTNSVDQMNAALMVDIGDRVVVANPPPWLPPGQISQIVQGYSESIGIFEHDLMFNCSPESVYHVAVLDDPVLAAADTDGSTLAGALSTILNTNGFFANGSTAGWSTGAHYTVAVIGTSGSATPLPAGGPTGFGVLITPDGSGSAYRFDESAAPFPAAGGQVYRASILVYSPNGTGAFKLGFNWQNAAGATISMSEANFTLAAGVWTAVSTSQTSDAAAAQASIRTGLGGTPAASDTLYVTAIVAWQGSVSVATTTAGSPLWTTAAGDFPFDVSVGGEQMKVISVSGASSPQTFTVARAVNGITKPQTAGTDVRLFQPAILSL